MLSPKLQHESVVLKKNWRSHKVGAMLRLEAGQAQALILSGIAVAVKPVAKMVWPAAVGGYETK